MTSKGKQLSVIIAGATGSTGSELVSRLVSHPDVSRVVALTRHPIPIKRWGSVFPHLNTADALQSLSVVPVDWEKIVADTVNIPTSYVTNGTWQLEEVREGRRHYLRRARAEVSLIAPGIPSGYVKYRPQNARDLLSNSDAEADAPDESTTAGEGRTNEIDEFSVSSQKLFDSQEFLRNMLESSFYSSIFTGHHVAINAIGTSHMLSTAQVTLVDYEISLAFAKLMRLFNCMAHAETSEDEERILVESTSKELNSTLWGEIYTACYGKRSSEAYDVSQEGITSDRYGGTVATPPADQRGILSRGSQATLLNFTQVSVRSASPKSMVPYLRTHGRRDRDLLCMFNRLPHDSARGEEDSTERHASFTEESILIGSSRPSPVKKGRLATLRDYLALLWSGRVTAADTEEEETASLTEEEANRRALEAVARQRAELLLRRDVVKVFENADVTIWQPGVLERPNPRLTERFFSLFSRPVHVGALAECITDDIIETIAEKPREIVLSTPKGTVKVIKGFSVSRRVQMKLLEDGLNVKDSQPKASFWRRRQYF